MIRTVSYLMAATLCFAVVGTAQAATDQHASAFVLCKNNKAVRSIRVMPGTEKSGAEKDDNCTITYSKGNTEEIVGTNRSLSSCRSIMKSIQANLESSKWSCRTVQSALVTTSSEVSHQ